MRLERDHMLKDITLGRYVLSDTVARTTSLRTKAISTNDCHTANFIWSTPATSSGRTPLTNMRRS
jgi:hypothetical protein